MKISRIFSLDLEVVETLKARSAATGVPMSKLVNRALRLILKIADPPVVPVFEPETPAVPEET